MDADTGDVEMRPLWFELKPGSGRTTSSSSSSSSSSSTIILLCALSLLTCSDRAEVVTRSYDAGDREKSRLSSSASLNAGDGGEGGKGTVRGSTNLMVGARGGAVNGAISTTGSTGIGTTKSSGSEVLRTCAGRGAEVLAPVSMASVGFRDRGDGLAARSGLKAGMGAGTVTGVAGFADFPVSFLIKDENDDPDRCGFGRAGAGIAIGWVARAIGAAFNVLRGERSVICPSTQQSKKGERTARLPAMEASLDWTSGSSPCPPLRDLADSACSL